MQANNKYLVEKKDVTFEQKSRNTVKEACCRQIIKFFQDETLRRQHNHHAAILNGSSSSVGGIGEGSKKGNGQKMVNKG